MTKMIGVSVKVPAWLKKEMDRHKDINWAEVIRSCIKRKLAEFKQSTVIDDLIEEYLRQNSEIKLRTLDLFANLLEKYFILKNIQIMYGENAINEAQKVLDDLRNLGVERPYDKIGSISVSEIIFSAFSKMGIYDLFEKKLQENLSNASTYLKDAIWLLSQYGSYIVPDGFKRTFEIMHPNFGGNILDELVKIGALYKDYYESRAYSHLQYTVPLYADLILYEFVADRIQLVKENLIKLLKEQWFRDFLKWVGNVKCAEAYEELKEDYRKKYGKKYGKELDEVISELKGIIIVDYWPRRRRVGKRKGTPPCWVIKMPSITLSLDMLIELVKSMEVMK